MSKHKISIKKFCVQPEKLVINNVDEAPVKKIMKTDIGNDSLHHSYDVHVSGHSTPIQKRDSLIDMEDSPELDYRCSPISMLLTQDGGNEIGWDWQTPANKNSNEKSKIANNTETPKRTKQLQKKRNSNSPLLHKPLKRKQVKMENIENIGKFSAMLKALDEKMKSIQQNCNNVVENETDSGCEHENKMMIESNNEEVIVNNDKSKINSITVNSNNGKDSNYEDLFDDSIDDSMVKCSQEIEEKLNLCPTKRNDIMELSTLSEEKESSSISEREFNLLTSANSIHSSKSSNISKTSSSNTSGHLKTYSNNSHKTNSIVNVSPSYSKLFNNNVINVPNTKQSLQDISDFPDDSFDDCLATFMEDDRLSEYDFCPPNSNRTSHSKNTCKQAVPSTINDKKMSSSCFSKSTAYNGRSNNHGNSKLITNNLGKTITDKEIVLNSFPNKSGSENKKFFKTKSLSDQSFCQSRNINSRTNVTTALNSVKPSVSTTFPAKSGQNLNKNNYFSSTNGLENTHTLNRLGEKEGGNCIMKYKSTSNLFSSKEVKESQPMHCTPEEIERKRLEAKLRLEAKRKLHQTNKKITDVPLQVKR
ncbi:unnamed protein product [Xylocopa violacea]|uniref:Uncharacterized protein n=2 Tax=Xylocopa violacea TaxID=135666 RepID=A0ABP1PE07_XYLVO